MPIIVKTFENDTSSNGDDFELCCNLKAEVISTLTFLCILLLVHLSLLWEHCVLLLHKLIVVAHMFI